MRPFNGLMNIEREADTMATKESQRVMASRKTRDQVSFLTVKGGRELLRVLALRDGSTAADLLRYAILLLAGLSEMPSAEDLRSLESVSDEDEASEAISRLQDLYGHADSDNKININMKPDEWAAVWNMSDQIESAMVDRNRKGFGFRGLDRIRIRMTQDQLVTVQRVLSEHDPRRVPEVDENGMKIFR